MPNRHSLVPNAKGYAIAPDVLTDLSTTAWSDPVFISGRTAELAEGVAYKDATPADWTISDDGPVFTADGSPIGQCIIQVQAGQVFMFTGSRDPNGLIGGVFLDEDEKIEVAIGSTVRFRAAGASRIDPVVTFTRLYNL